MKPVHRYLTLLGRLALAGFMLTAGIGHFRSTQSFLAQVPPFLPLPELIVQVSGVIEIGLALGLVFGGRYLQQVGWLLAGFYVVIFPGNISQFLTQTPAFGLDSDLARGIRLLFQPLLIAWALWCTGAWTQWRNRK